MSKPIEILGAAASNAGDAFHESWALRQALRLLDQNPELTHLTVEGVREAAETDNNANWDGVDCALYFENPGNSSPSRVELVQLKYSVASKNKNWTLSRLCSSTSKKGNNSVARRLADAFKGASKGHTAKVIKVSIAVKLVTNQPIASDLSKCISLCAENELKGSKYEQLKKATGLGKLQLKNFCTTLSLLGGELSRAELREENTKAVAELIQAPVKEMVDSLQLRIQERMGPEPSRDITKETVLSWFSLGQNEGLFPCEPRLEPLVLILDRRVSSDLFSAVEANPIVVFHGNGGCGKTTAATSLESLLPRGSKVIIYDCYGAGSYRDQSQPRHKSREAFTQLSNELARATSSPLFFPYNNQEDMAPSFRHKLQTASEIFARENPDALLVFVIDAADNAVSQANSHTLPDTCFVHQLLTFEDLPKNVRFVVSTRTSRLPSLKAPSSLPKVICPPFELAETQAFLALYDLEGDDAAVEDFHILSKATPRVQSNAIKGAQELEDAIRFLRPNGKSLSDLFGGMIDEAFKRGGVTIDRCMLSAALTELPSPIPIKYLSSACDLPELVVEDLVSDLASNVRLTNQCVEFSNEDFEAFCEEDGTNSSPFTRTTIANMMVADRMSSGYAAMHLFDALVVSGRKEELAAHLAEPDGTAAISDPVVRRSTDLARLQAALHIATSGQDEVAVGETIFIGAEAMRSAGKVEEIMVENADLSAAFVSNTIASLILNDPKERARQGPILMQLAADKARQGKHFESRLNFRAATEWMEGHFAAKEKGHRWETQDEDVLAQLVTRFILGGWPAVEADCVRWSPSSYGVCLRFRALSRITIEHGPDAIIQVLPELKPQFLFFALNCLSRAGRKPTKKVTVQAFRELTSFDFKVVGSNGGLGIEEPLDSEIMNEVLYFFECFATTGELSKLEILSMVDKIWPVEMRQFDKLTLLRAYELDQGLRLLILTLRLRGEEFELEKSFEKPVAPNKNELSVEDRREFKIASDRYDEVSGVLSAYKIYAKLLTEPSVLSATELERKITSLGSTSGRSHHHSRIRNLLRKRATDFLGSVQSSEKLRMTFFKTAMVEHDGFTDAAVEISVTLLHEPAMQEPVANALGIKAQGVRKMQIKALEKSESLIALARVFLLFSRDNAEAYFTEALKVAEEVDLEALDILHAICRMVKRERPDTSENRELIGRFARVVRFSGDLLQNEDGFPQGEAVRAMTVANLPVAAMTISRWSDEGFVDRGEDLNSFLKTAQQNDVLSLQQIYLLTGLLARPSSTLNSELLVRAKELSDAGDGNILKEIIGQKIVAVTPSSVSDTDDDVLKVSKANPDSADDIRLLQDTIAFKQSVAQSTIASGSNDEDDVAEDTSKFDWESVDPFDENDIRAARMNDLKNGIYEYDKALLSLRSRVGFPNRVRHLNTLAKCALGTRVVDSELNAIFAALACWEDEAVAKWRKLDLPKLTVDLGAKTLGYNWYHGEQFGELQSASRQEPEARRKVVTDIVESNTFKLGSANLLKLLASFTCDLDVSSADRLLTKLLDRFEKRLNMQVADLKRYDFDTEALPAESQQITAALLYRYLGDIDARVRWKATHQLRLAARIQSTDLIGEVLDVAVLGDGFPYTFNDCPFQKMNADLHLALMFARISFEAPELVAQFEDKLILLWDKCNPHILIGHFLSRALTQARLSGQSIRISEEKIATMNGKAAKRISKPEGKVKRTLASHVDVGERFNFDSMDVIPYWYKPALKAFADLPLSVLIETAEKWIVDRWDEHEKSSHWKNEPRQRRLRDDEFGLYSTRHGSMPTIHRHSMYLQWHGLFAAVGDLLQVYALLDETEDKYDSFTGWLERHDTTYPDFWIADALATVPFQQQYWVRPEPQRTEWAAEINDIAPCSQIYTEDGEFILYQHHEAHEYAYGKHAAGDEVRSKVAFVPRKTAKALLRTYAMTTEYHDIFLPERDDFDRRRGMNESFILIPAICRPLANRDSGIDDQDPQRFGTRGISFAPSQELLSAAGMRAQKPSTTKWYIENGIEPLIFYRGWSTRPDDSDRSLRHQSYSFVDGERLCIDSKLLLRIMESLDCDLLMTMNFERSIGDYDYGENSKKRISRKRVEVIHFTRDGRSETASGDLGTW